MSDLTPNELLEADLAELSDQLKAMFTPDGVEAFVFYKQRLRDDHDGKDTDDIVSFAEHGVIDADFALSLMILAAYGAGRFHELRPSAKDFARRHLRGLEQQT